MADNITTTTTVSTIPSGTKISTDEDATNGHVQRVKLAFSADGVSTHVTADADGVLVNLGANNDVTVTGSVTANAGTNLNTSTLALEAGGNLAGAATSLAVVDDWDESDRAKVNPIVGQAGVAAGAGAVAATVQRVTLASDDPAVVSLAALDNAVAGSELQVDVVGALPAGTNNIGDVDIASVPAPLSTTGAGTEAAALRVTVATDSTGVLSVDDNGSTISVDDGAGSLTVDGTVAVSSLPALAAGTANIGDVDVLTVPAPLSTTGGGTEATALRVTLANDSTGLVSVDDGGGALTVDGTVAVSGTVTVGSHAVTNAGTFAVQIDAGAVTSLALLDDAVKTDDAAFTPATDKVLMIGAEADEGSPDSVDEGDAGALRMTLTRALHVNLRDSAGDEIAVGGGTQYTEDAAAAANPVGTVPMLVRKDTPASEVTTDGDNVAQRGTTYGAAYVTLLDTGGSAVAVGGGTQYTEDAAAAANPIGNALNLIRADALAGVTTTDGDNVAARGTDNGELYVKHVDAIPVTDNGGALTVDGTVAVSSITTAVVPGTGATNLGKAEDAAHSSGDVGVMALSVRQDTAAALGGTDADYQPLISDGSGRLHVNVGNTVTVGSHAVTNAGTFVTQENGAALTALQLIDDAVFAEDVAAQAADKGIAVLAVRRDADTTLVGADNDYANLQVDANGALKVEIFDGGGSHTVDNAGTFVVQENGAALTALQLVDNPIFADDAAFTAGTSSVNVQGVLAVAHGDPDSADAGDAVAPIANRDRVQWTIGGHPNSKSATYITTGAQTDDTVLAAIGAGTVYAITRITVTVDSAATVSTAVRLGFGTANVPALPSSGSDAVDDILCYHPGLVPGSGFTIGDGSGVLGVGADGAELRITCGAPTGGTLAVSVTYYPIAS